MYIQQYRGHFCRITIAIDSPYHPMSVVGVQDIFHREQQCTRKTLMLKLLLHSLVVVVVACNIVIAIEAENQPETDGRRKS